MIRILIIVLRGENVGKDLTKSPSQLPERAISVIRLETENINVGKDVKRKIKGVTY